MSIVKLNLNLIRNQLIFKSSRRYILTPAYACKEEWNKRLDDPLIKNIELDAFFYQLNEKLTKKTSIVPTDVDLFLNRASNKNLNEVVNIVQRFRKNWRSRGMLESSHHAFIRIFLEDDNQLDRLVDILSKRIEYGIFPDKFSYNLILDRLIELDQRENAVKVAVLRMLQEDSFDSQIGNLLSVKACSLYLNGGGDEIKPELFSVQAAATEEKNNEEEKNEASEDEDEDEVEYIRVPYLRNPFFDDHFDLKETYSLVGKTLYLNGLALAEKNDCNELGDNCVLYGLCLYKKWDKVLEYLDEHSDCKRTKDMVELVEKFISTTTTTQLEDKIEDDDKIRQVQSKLNALPTSEKSFEELIEERLKQVNSLEAKEINELRNAFKEFAHLRETKLKADLDELLRLEIIEQIKEKKKELKERETKLYFFENHEQFKLLEHEAKIKIKEAEDSMRIEEEYIPPRYN